jgi:hypothetical protein
MPELTVTTARANELPTILFERGDDFAYLHAVGEYARTRLSRLALDAKQTTTRFCSR